MKEIRCIAFDADDTLWHNEELFRQTEERFEQLLAKYHSREWISQQLYETEEKNLLHFGYGIKGFTLSMIETAIQLTEGRIQGEEIQQIIDFARDMLHQPVRLLQHVEETVVRLSQSHDLMVITKGDLFDQEAKIARSGLAEYFCRVEIVTKKDEAVYQKILHKHEIAPRHFLMVGNSLKSDILPVLAIGARAVYIPYHTTWEHEAVEGHDARKLIEMKHIGRLPELF